ncbi:uncharacterized protein LOC123662423 [Melitaea cinxia]|uniref:uncharacterized protein LOC123662423 n=1 Tax=Melitaea cinxia TaxID=113334 RepID=UPI001E272247|nr:uncharacterized protein LOC123662423 [Melitaea cinxia]
MSTRSGKRIHSIANENVENIFESKSDRNTRSKRQKIENDLPFTEKKRKNYVRYPSEENVANIEKIAPSVPKLRRHTLKEQNILATDSETSNDERKTVRSTRRTKINEEELENTETKVEKVATEKKQKGKKKSVKPIVTEENNENIPQIKISKKKSNKKKSKKKSNSIVVEEIHDNVDNKNLNNSKASNDSFHSAPGSPTSIPSAEEPSSGISDNKLRKNKKHDIVESNILAEKTNRKRKITIEMECDANNDDIKDDSNQKLLSNPDHKSITNQANVSNEKAQEKDEFNESIEISFKNKKRANKKSKRDKTDASFEIDNANEELITSKLNNTDTKHSSPRIATNFNTTFDKESCQSDIDVIKITSSASKNKRKSSIKNSTYDKIDNQSIMNLDVTFEKESQSKAENFLASNTTAELKDSSNSKDSFIQNNTITLNNTYDKNSKTEIIANSLNTTFDKPTKLDTTFDKNLKKDSIDQSQMNPQAKSSLISSDTTESSTINITDDNSHVSLTSDESKTENILNTTPVLIESSMDDSSVVNNELTTETKKTPLKRQGTFTEITKDSPLNRGKETKPITPLKRDITFTESDITPKKNTPDSKHNPRRSSINTPQSTKKISTTKPETPLKREGTFTKDSPDVTMSPKLKNQLTPRRKSLPSPGCTPFPHSKSSSKEKSVLNLTRSIEKSRRSSVADVPPRMTKVMFCSPVNNPVVVSQMKGKVIKSNLKGSNKSFIFDDSDCRPARKRSHTHSEADGERTAQLRSAQRLSRSRTASATARLQDTSPAKKPTKEARRTKLPNFAALHKKQFARMESLDECVMRKAKRAKLLLTPNTASKTLRTSPKDIHPQNSKEVPADPQKKETPKSKQPEPNPGFTRFGFKLNLDVNPFSIPPKNEVKEKQAVLKRQVTLPSLAGATNLRREIAKQAVMREKSFTEKRYTNRDENRTVIKGVRTNRRFELQMKMRNINNQ